MKEKRAAVGRDGSAFELVIAGESADFEFYMDRMFCEHYGIATNE